LLGFLAGAADMQGDAVGGHDLRVADLRGLCFNNRSPGGHGCHGQEARPQDLGGILAMDAQHVVTPFMQSWLPTMSYNRNKHAKRQNRQNVPTQSAGLA
jgi:hypothetical protein